MKGKRGVAASFSDQTRSDHDIDPTIVNCTVLIAWLLAFDIVTITRFDPGSF